MREARGGARLVQEQRVERGALLGRQVEVQRLDGDEPRQQRVVRGIHGAEPALADAVLQRVAADVADRGERVAVLLFRGDLGEGGLRRGECLADVGVAPQAGVRLARRGGRLAVGRQARGRYGRHRN